MITLKEILKVTGGTLEKAGNPLFSSISTDSRNIKKGDLFIPIKGEKFLMGTVLYRQRLKAEQPEPLHQKR